MTSPYLSRMPIISRDPATGLVLAEYDEHDDDGVAWAVEAAAHAQRGWAVRPVEARAGVLRKAAEILEMRYEAMAKDAVREMGKTIRGARDEVRKCVAALRWYADHGADGLADETVAADGVVGYRPLGVVLAVMPWNFPFWQVIRAAAPTLLAGNAMVLKHASNVPQCALALEGLFRDAGAPPGLFTAILVPGHRVAPIVAHPDIAAVTLTGSEAAGRSVAAAAGAALKPCVLELGGNDPFIVLADADVEQAAEVAVRSRLMNSGQSCIAAKRFLVESTVYGPFREALLRRMGEVIVGDPSEETTDVGPLATRAIRDELAAQVAATVAAGAQVRLGGAPIPGDGAFYAPTVLEDVPWESPAATEELFGPVAPLFVVADAEEAVRRANDSHFGLGAAIWTSDIPRARDLAARLAAGTVAINGMVASDVRFPFGGVKRSGMGRELGRWGLQAFTNVQAVRTPG